MENLSIGAVARMTGLTELRIRAWERRYNMNGPKRTESGRRLYSLKDVERLKLIKALSEQGHPLSTIAGLEIKDLRRLLGGHEPPSSRITTEIHHLLQAITDLDLPRFTSLLKAAQLKHDTRGFLLQVVSPLMRNIGQGVTRGDLDIYHEHTASAAIRTILTGLLYSLDLNGDPESESVVLLATPEGDHHEFGILIAGLLCAVNDRRLFYFGPNLPAASLAKGASCFRKPLIVLGVSAPATSLPTPKLQAYVRELLGRLPKSASVWIGGTRNHEISTQDPRVKYIGSLEDFERELR